MVALGFLPAPAAAVVVAGPWTPVTSPTWPLRVGFLPEPASASLVSPPIPLQSIEKPLTWRSQLWPVPDHDPDTGRVDPGWAPASEETGVWGVQRIFVDGRDRTFFRGAPLILESWSGVEPFGDGSGTLSVPNVAPKEILGEGDLLWLLIGSPVDVYRLDADETLSLLYSGFIASHEATYDGTTAELRLQLAGALFQADLARVQPALDGDPIDIGLAIGAALSGVVSRRYSRVRGVVTGILTRNRGTAEQSPLGYAQELLATAVTNDGQNQWTVKRVETAPRNYYLALKDRAVVQWTVVAGQPGVGVSFVRDHADGPNVIYGNGVAPGGGRWANWKYPNLVPDAAPPYPNADAGQTITVGGTDAGTDSGTGVSTWQRRSNELGYGVKVDGAFGSRDADALRQIQTQFGLAVDGVLGPQSWAATFQVGSGAGDLTGAFRMPLAYRPEVMPVLYNPDGTVKGPNPGYDPTTIRIERELTFGAGVTKSDGITSGRQYLAREWQQRLAGTLGLDVDPAEGSRYDIREGHNIRVRGLHGTIGPTMHVAGVDHQLGGRSSLTVDQKARDLMTVAEVLARSKENLADPGRRPGPVNRRSRLQQDATGEFDADSAAGQIPRHALYGGLWNVLRIPVSQLGRIAKVDYRTTSPARAFCLALFGAPITPAQLVHVVGNPLAERDDGFRPFDDRLELLEDRFGFIEALGGPGQAAGYYPGSQSGGTPVTGRLYDTGGIDYVSARPPWCWLAEWSAGSCFAQGRLYVAPLI